MGKSEGVIGRLSGLDLLRGIAALGVAFYHFTQIPPLFLHDQQHFPVVWVGMRGVFVFFLLSGFVILATAYRVADRRAFVLARFWRLYPAFVACLLLTTGFIFLFGIRKPPALDWVLNLTMWPRLFGAAYVDTPYWTLGFEIAFYAVVAVMLPAIKRGYALHLCALALIVSLFIPADIAACGVLFVIGAALFEVRRSRLPALAIMVAGVLLSHDPLWTSAELAIVAAAASIKIPDRLIPFARWAGAVSYPFYLSHCMIGVYFVTVVATLSGSIAAGIAIALPLTVLLAAAVERFEAWFRNHRASLTDFLCGRLFQRLLPHLSAHGRANPG